MGAERERALALTEIGRYGDALELLGRAAAADPHDASIHSVRAACLLNLDRPAEALDATSSALEIDPACGDAFRLRSRALEDLGAPRADVIAAAQRAIELQPGDSAMWLQLIRTLVLAEQHREAAHYLSHMRYRFPDNIDTEVATAVVELGRPDVILGAIRSIPGPVYWAVSIIVILSGGALIILALIGIRKLADLRSARRAEVSVLRALEHDPGSLHLQTLLADLYTAQGRRRKALELRVHIGRTDPTPELVASVTRTVLWELIGLAVVVAGVGAVGIMLVLIAMVAGVPLWFGAGLVVACTVGALQLIRIGAHRVLVKVPTALGERVLAQLRPWRVGAAVQLAIIGVACAFIPDQADPAVSMAPIRWTAAGVVVGLVGVAAADRWIRSRASS